MQRCGRDVWEIGGSDGKLLVSLHTWIYHSFMLRFLMLLGIFFLLNIDLANENSAKVESSVHVY